MPLTSYPTGSGIFLACGPETANVNERYGELSGVPLACGPEAAIVNKRDGNVAIGASARKFWQGKMSAKVPEVEKRTFGRFKPRNVWKESAIEFDDWAERFKDHLTVSGKNFTGTVSGANHNAGLGHDCTQSQAGLSSIQFLRRLTPLIEATNQSLTETQRNEKVCEEFLDRLKPNMSFLIRLVGLTQAKSLDVVKAQAEELEALLLVNRGEEVSRLSQAVNVINSRPSQPQWSAGPSPGAAGNEQGPSGSNTRNFGQFSAPNGQKQPPSFGGERGGFRSQNNWSGYRQCQYCGRMGHLAYACHEWQADFEDDQGRSRIEMSVRSNTGRPAAEEGSGSETLNTTLPFKKKQQKNNWLEGQKQ
uniref:CCHC-type domain-containing protein n=1 Tax=Globodera rostochiensis TaxID=31243 RepID=A0A914HB88_GLORO